MNSLNRLNMLKRDINTINTYKSTQNKNSTHKTAVNNCNSTNIELLKFDKLKSSTNFLNNTFNPVTFKDITENAQPKDEKENGKIKTKNMTLLTILLEQELKKKNINVDVKSLASSQVNETASISPEVQSLIDKIDESGIYDYLFKINCGGKTKDISLKLNSTDTAKDILSKISSAINSSNTNVKAEVVSTSDKKLYLRITSNETGENSKFTFTDVKGNLTSKLGLNNVVKNPKNAVYSVDGKEYKSQSNDVWLENNTVKVHLNKIGKTEVKINIEDYLKNVNKNKDKVIENIGDGINCCNLLGKDLNPFYDKSKGNLSNLGLELNSENKLVFNRDFLRKQIQNNILSVTNSMVGNSGGLDFFNSVSSNVFNTQPLMSSPYLRNSHILQRGHFSETF